MNSVLRKQEDCLDGEEQVLLAEGMAAEINGELKWSQRKG